MSCHECSGQRGTNTHSLHTQVRTTVSEDDNTVTEVTPWTSMPQFMLPELPSDLDLIGGSSEMGKAWRIPVQRILPGGDLNQFRYLINKKMQPITVPRGHVIPVRIPNSQEPVEVAQGTAGRWAQSVAISSSSKHLVIQSTGFVTFPRTHVYTVGKTYYLSKDVPGQVVSVKPTPESQALFTVIDEVTISLNVELK